MTHSEATKQDEVFIKACELSGTPATKRQHSKYLLKRGKAASKKDEAIAALMPKEAVV